MVKLVYTSPLVLIYNAINYSHGNQHKNKSITEPVGKDELNLIKKVGFHLNHSSVLEHSLIVYDVELSTKALLELSRHRIGVSMTVSSSRYALDKIGINIEPVGDSQIDFILEQFKEMIEIHLKGKKKKEFDKIAMLLPQAFMYKAQISFNLRSLKHFLELRTSKAAHYSIRQLANDMLLVLPNDYKYLLKDLE